MSGIRTRHRTNTYVKDWLNNYPFNRQLPPATSYVLNGGWTDTTDWKDKNTDGVGDEWAVATRTLAVLLRAGNGFTDVHQKIYPDGTNAICLYCNDFGLLDANKRIFHIRFIYRSNVNFTVALLISRPPTASWSQTYRVYSNTGNAKLFEAIKVVPRRASFRGLVFYAPSASSSYIDIDEVAVIEEES